MNPYEKRSELKKSKIKKSTLHLLGLHSVEHISIKMIADHSGVSRATIYKHFDSKEKLIVTVLNEIIEKSIVESEKILNKQASFIEKFNEITDLKSDVFLFTLKAGINFLYFQSDLIQDVLSARHQEQLDRMSKKLFDQGREEGFIHSDLNNEEIKDFLHVVKAGMNELRKKGDPVMNDIVRLRRLNDLFIRAIS
ncbi:TetR/AcrR family transcriptional regulator [Fusibacter sp. JL216-2]|uniref:TetR/AcrR family transcriptional regulator n=1 Tax=Fusibacter sp. JL216-2 TaxID=3071453 RepID=UPI003D33B087